MKPHEYRKLIQEFLDGKFKDAEEFAQTYDKIFLKEPGGMDEELFHILGDFWTDVEAYSPLWEPEDIKNCTLRKKLCVKKRLMQLESWMLIYW